MGTYTQTILLVESPGYELCKAQMNKRMKVDWPVIEKGTYEQFKNQAMALVRLPRIGAKYRLLNDEFAESWVLHHVENTRVPRATRTTRWPATPFLASPRDHVYTFCFATIKQTEEETLYVSDTVRFSCFLSEWGQKMDAGEIVEDGKDLPEGRIRNWAIGKGIRYVLQFDVKRLHDFMFSGNNFVYESEEHYDRARESHATRLSTRGFERVRRTLYRRALANQVGAPVHRQYRPKIP